MTTDRYPEILADLRDQAAAIATRHGLPVPDAKALGAELAEAIRADWRGQIIYIPKGAAYDTDTRADQIYERYDGRNREALIREYDLSISNFYTIINRGRQRAITRRQRDLDL